MKDFPRISKTAMTWVSSSFIAFSVLFPLSLPLPLQIYHGLSRPFYLVSLNVMSVANLLSITKVVKSFLAWRTSKIAECCSAMLCVAVRCCFFQFLAVYIWDGRKKFNVNTTLKATHPAWLANCRPMAHAHIYETLQHTATHCNTLKHIATYCNTMQHFETLCSTLQHTATHCPLMTNAHIYETRQHTATRCITLQHAATRCNTLQHTTTHCNTLQHTGASREIESEIETANWIWPVSSSVL